MVRNGAASAGRTGYFFAWSGLNERAGAPAGGKQKWKG
jgi:hypothetical protein